MVDRDTNLIIFKLFRDVTRDGMTVKVHIHRLEDRPGWALEVARQIWTVR